MGFAIVKQFLILLFKMKPVKKGNMMNYRIYYSNHNFCEGDSVIEFGNRLEVFTNMHNDYIQDWNEAMNSGNTSKLDRMAEDYFVTFFKGGNDKPIFFSKQDALSGMQQSVKHFIGAEKKFENRVIRMKDDDHATVFFEQVIVKNEQVLARLFTIENWQLINGRWFIIRETEEAIN